MRDEKRRITAQCIGIILICFALGMFIGGLVDHISFTQTSHEQTATNEIHYLGGADSSDYYIEFNNELKRTSDGFEIEGLFVNTTKKHKCQDAGSIQETAAAFSKAENASILFVKIFMKCQENNKIDDLIISCNGLHSEQAWKFSTKTNLDIDISSITIMLDDVTVTV